jgi:hypothetical protein
MFARPLGPCVKAAEGTPQAAAAVTRGQVGLRSHHTGAGRVRGYAPCRSRVR